MKLSRLVLVAAVLFAGCFDEGGNESRDKAVSTLVQGLIAFGDIHSNIETDPGKAGEALLEFIKWPVAADSLLSPPFEGANDVMDASPRLAPTSPVPACLTQSGEPSCDNYVTNDTCEAGGFTFSGSMMRRCWDCDDPRGVCSYAWTMPRLAFTSAKFNISMSTAGSRTGAASQITQNLSARYDLDDPAGGGEIARRGGNLTACACTVFNIVDSDTESGKPRKLVISSFIVSAKLDSGRLAERCALVLFDGNGNATVENKCACPGGQACVAPDPTLSWPALCGNSTCDSPVETYENCPVDCGYVPAVCGNDKCEIGESTETCLEDCGLG
jgi:hypothetical protein